MAASIICVAPLGAQTAGGTVEPETTQSKTDKRLFGVLPNYRTVDASVPFASLSRRQKLSIARHDSFDWPTYVLAAGLTFVTPGGKAASYGSGLAGFANRYVRTSADQIAGNMLSEGFLPVVLGEDPRYFRPGTGATWSRLRSALAQIAVAHDDKGHHTLNLSEFLGNGIAVGISSAYSPNLNSWSHRSEKLALMLSTDTFSNVLKEFGPDLRERFFHRHHKSS